MYRKLVKGGADLNVRKDDEHIAAHLKHEVVTFDALSALLCIMARANIAEVS